ncbi:MAG: Rne/Rng family ribonuclease [Acidimicrobiales bacterium]
MAREKIKVVREQPAGSPKTSDESSNDVSRRTTVRRTRQGSEQRTAEGAEGTSVESVTAVGSDSSSAGSRPRRARAPRANPATREVAGSVVGSTVEENSARASSDSQTGMAQKSSPGREVVTSEPETGSGTPPSLEKRRRRLKSKAQSGPSIASGPVEYRTEGQLADTLAAGPRSRRRMNQRAPRERNGRPVGRYLMCVQVRDGVTQIAILEGRTLIEHYVSRESDDQYSIDGNLYLGRVANVLPGMEAAFIDIGTSKNAVIYRGDVRFDRDDLESDDRSVRIEQLLRPKQTVVCQVVKNPIGAKGARLTQEVSLPGRFIVLIPNSNSYGISKRLPDEERRRLRKILDEVKPEGFGVIVRTAAEGASADELRRDLNRLIDMWGQIDQKAKRSHAPTLLYREPQVALRVIREEFSRNYRGVIIDNRELYEEVVSYVAAISPELADRVEFYDEEENGVPVFEAHHVHEQLHKALARKVWLPSGGSLVIDRAEALTVIDVNTAKNVGSVSLETTIYKNNLEAVEEIAHQLRLRDIGGIIVIDFVDMLSRESRDEVMRAFRAAVARDKTKSHVYDMSPLCLVEMTRQRVSEGLVEAFSGICPTCNGRGLIFDQVLLQERIE